MAKRNVLHIDLETRSAFNLKNGVYGYAEHFSTSIILASYALNDGPIKTWYIIWGEEMPADLRAALLDPSIILVAHNSSFESVLLRVTGRKFMPPDVIKALAPMERWSCTAVRSAALGLPRSLENSAKALRLDVAKDKEGAETMLAMCQPNGVDAWGNYTWKEDRESVLRLGQYCEMDVLVEQRLDELLPELSSKELKVWYATGRMNDRGIQLDGAFVEKMVTFVQDAEKDINFRINAITNGEVDKVTKTAKLKEWLNNRDFNVENVGKNTLKEILAPHIKYEEELKKNGGDESEMDEAILDGRLPDHIKEVLILRRDGGRSSAGKYKSAMARMNRDARARGAIFYCGAASTGRFSARGLQVQNLARGGGVKGLNVEKVIDAIKNGATPEDIRQMCKAPPIVVASDLVRPSFMAKAGHWLARGDYSQIEARVAAWLGNQQNTLQAFRDYDTFTGETDANGALLRDGDGVPLRKGADIYKITARDIVSLLYGTTALSDVTKDQRQTFGKVPVLACGFQGGKGAFAAFARLYGVNISEDDQQAIVDAFRDANPGLRAAWYVFNRASIECMKGEPGEIHWCATRAGDERLSNPGTGKLLIGDVVIPPRIFFRRDNRRIVMRLPSGRNIIYWYPRLVEKETPWGKPKLTMTYMALDPMKNQWWTFSAYGGILFQNCVQAIARDVAAESFAALDEAGMNPVLLVHDEAVCEVSKSRFPTEEEAGAAVGAIMAREVDWAPGLPIAVDFSAAERYVKA